MKTYLVYSKTMTTALPLVCNDETVKHWERHAGMNIVEMVPASELRERESLAVSAAVRARDRLLAMHEEFFVWCMNACSETCPPWWREARDQGEENDDGRAFCIRYLRRVRESTIDSRPSPAVDVLARIRAFLAKYDAIMDSADYKAVFQSAWIHGVKYEGPSMKAEVDALRSLVDGSPKAEKKENA